MAALLFLLLCALAGELCVPEVPEPSSSPLGSCLISGFLSSPVAPDDDVSMGSALQPSPDGSSFFT